LVVSLLFEAHRSPTVVVVLAVVVAVFVVAVVAVDDAVAAVFVA
jgi:hypothetical protein